MNKFYFNLQSAFLFVGGTRDVIFKMKTKWHEGYEERKKCICCMVRNAAVFFFIIIFGLGHLICSSVPSLKF